MNLSSPEQAGPIGIQIVPANQKTETPGGPIRVQRGGTMDWGSFKDFTRNTIKGSVSREFQGSQVVPIEISSSRNVSAGSSLAFYSAAAFYFTENH
jgi:hypothetical protein